MELLQLKYFCDAAVSQNFSATARKFFVPPSGVSQSIARLEKELGCALFLHRGNRVMLNESGSRFYQSASVALALLEEGREALCHREGTVTGELDIVCNCNRSTVTRAIERFTVSHPEVSLLLRHEIPEEADFDILISDRCKVAYKKRVLIVAEPICLAVSKRHPLAAREKISFSDLLGERFISMPEKNSLYEIMVESCAAAGFVPNIAIRLEDPFYIRKYVELGLGVTLVPAVSWEGLFSNNVALIPLPGLWRKVYAYLPAQRNEKQATVKFLEILSGISRS